MNKREENEYFDMYEFAYGLHFNTRVRKIVGICLLIFYAIDLLTYFISKIFLFKINSIISFVLIIFSIATIPILFGALISFFPFKEKKKNIADEISGTLSNFTYELIKDYLGESQKGKESIVTRAQQASIYIINAGSILSELQQELDSKNNSLQELIHTVENKKSDAEHWEQIASINEKLAEPLTKEIERRFRNEMSRNKLKRIIISITKDIVLLVAGGAIGVLFQKWFL